MELHSCYSNEYLKAIYVLDTRRSISSIRLVALIGILVAIASLFSSLQLAHGAHSFSAYDEDNEELDRDQLFDGTIGQTQSFATTKRKLMATPKSAHHKRIRSKQAHDGRVTNSKTYSSKYNDKKRPGRRQSSFNKTNQSRSWPDCGLAPLNRLTQPIGYIVNGAVENLGDWPSFVFIRIKFKNSVTKCGGVLIGDRSVLTAAHCFVTFGDIYESTTVYLGDHLINHPDKNEKAYRTNNLPKCTSKFSGNGPMVIYDYAMITLNGPVEFTDYIQPACLPENDPWLGMGEDSICYMVGGGALGFDGDYLIDSQVVQYMRMVQVSCLESWGIPDTDLTRSCWRKFSDPGSVCKGDSGGPILCLDKRRRWTVAGLSSLASNKCDGVGLGGWVSLFTRVPTLIESIKSECMQ